ncbi:hypothetical protein QQS21_000821 [Conoideocrella luteorostrata]|uniref:BZIP transcription factor n=1 Tax=Conoideocrella luteorostrata TaxID=1105319 RepID=A0AAJ0FY36_9HYPO|nr:hypothetical protein QQS21_000821 [Conoideocrella luteorostrata]
MPPAEKPDRPAKRARTDAQLAQKRQTDRVKHKLNRAESKTRLENIEKDVSFLRDSIGDLLSQLRHLQPPPSGSVDPVGSQALGGYPPRPGIEMAPSPDAAATVAPFTLGIISIFTANYLSRLSLRLTAPRPIRMSRTPQLHGTLRVAYGLVSKSSVGILNSTHPNTAKHVAAHYG